MVYMPSVTDLNGQYSDAYAHLLVRQPRWV